MMNWRIKFDPRSKLATVLVASLAFMVPLRVPAEIIFVTFLFIVLLCNGSRLRACLYYGLFWLLLGFDQLFLQQLPHESFVVHFVSFLTIGARRLMPPIMAARFANVGTKISEWIAALKKLHVPFSLIVPLTVLFRFFPTVIADFKSIRKALKFRGIATSNWQLLIHPLKTMEYILIPILFSADTMTNDLSAAALVRGLGSDAQYTSVYTLKFRLQDYCLCLCLLGLIVWRLVG